MMKSKLKKCYLCLHFFSSKRDYTTLCNYVGLLKMGSVSISVFLILISIFEAYANAGLVVLAAGVVELQGANS